MKSAAKLLFFTLFSGSLSLYAQQGVPKPDASSPSVMPADADSQTPAQAPAPKPDATTPAVSPQDAPAQSPAQNVTPKPDASTPPVDSAPPAPKPDAPTPSATPAEVPAPATTQAPAPKPDTASPAATSSAPSSVPVVTPKPEAPSPAQAPAVPQAQVPTVAPAPAVAEPAPAQDIDADYTLGTDDAIMVHVWKEPTISGPLTIRPDGRVSLPLVGDIAAAGLTPMALASVIAEDLKKFINDPSVTVTVTAANSRKIFFVGEVLRSGPLPLTRSMSMLQAISAAGGLTPYANKKKIYILRGEKGKETKIPFDYNKALKEGNDQGVVLLPGDTIVVP